MGSLKAVITCVNAYVPDYILTNKELETLVDTNDEWIRTRTGIEERRLLKGEGKGTSELASQAVLGLLEKSGTDPLDVDLIIVATVTADMHFPDTATITAHKTGMKNAFGFDLSAACSGFLFALTTGARYVESGNYKKVIVVGADKMSSIMDFEDRSTCILFGDGGGAVLLEPQESPYGFMDSILHSDGAGEQYLHMKGGGSRYPSTHETVDKKMHYLFQDGRPVFKAAVKGMSSSISALLKKNALSPDDISWIIPHQANKRILNAVADYLDFPIERVAINIEKYGNTTAATIPICLWEWEKKLKEGDNLILTAFGGGFTWGAIYIKWAYNGNNN